MDIPQFMDLQSKTDLVASGGQGRSSPTNVEIECFTFYTLEVIAKQGKAKVLHMGSSH